MPEEESTSLIDQLRESQALPTREDQGKGTSTCYKVQARVCKNCGPTQITGVESSGWMGPDNILTDTRWKTLYFPQGPVGVPPSNYNQDYARYGYYSYQAAQALRWWFLAEQKQTTAIETRLVEYKFTYAYSAEPVKAVGFIDPEKRQNIMPDWDSERLEREEYERLKAKYEAGK